MESNKISGYFHVALMNGYAGLIIASEMHGRLLDSGLYDATDKIEVCILGDKSQGQLIIDHIFSRYNKYHVHLFDENLLLYEWPTLLKAYDDCQKSDSDVWYIHTKGVSNSRSDVPARVQHNLLAWRSVMSYWVIKRYETCRNLLKTGFDAVGPFYVLEPPHFSGNFWWAKSSHIRSLGNPSGNRSQAEFWIGSYNGSKLKSLCEFPKGFVDLYDFSNRFGEFGPFQGYIGNV